MTALNVLVVDEFDSDRVLERTLRQHGCEVATLKLQELDMLRIVQTLHPDVVVLNLYTPTEPILKTIVEINQSYSLPVVMFAEDQQTETINKVIKAGVSAYIVDGLEAKRIKSIVDIAIARFKEHQALKDELKKTKTQLEDRKLVDRAKAILMKSQGFSEEQAYHALRKLAMDRNMAIGEMAKNVISMAELFK
ncbi:MULTISPECIES: ANTAR domain-containing protein [Methylomonas]|uniref:Response regulator receiver protein n=1 Tax=Methylomonas koyamae TaxID=702114 RepID=A0A177NLA9_9GAMM|nr:MULTISPECIES: ANTAR domain-containing protein [Methylomonas]OAI17979.1 response regulator receiver protein [Methylomonas koyamae]WGS87419.1 ANTAR domain-containing protein [Methylomonas sp. UP202]